MAMEQYGVELKRTSMFVNNGVCSNEKDCVREKKRTLEEDSAAKARRYKAEENVEAIVRCYMHECVLF